MLLILQFPLLFFFFFFNDTATTEIYTPLYTLSLHDALPISAEVRLEQVGLGALAVTDDPPQRSEEHTSELQSHSGISYAVFCLKKKKAIGEPVSLAHATQFERLANHPERRRSRLVHFFFNDTPTTEISTPLYTLSLHDDLPISRRGTRPARPHRAALPPPRPPRPSPRR